MEKMAEHDRRYEWTESLHFLRHVLFFFFSSCRLNLVAHRPERSSFLQLSSSSSRDILYDNGIYGPSPPLALHLRTLTVLLFRDKLTVTPGSFGLFCSLFPATSVEPSNRGIKRQLAV